MLDKLKPQFISNGTGKGHDEKILEKIWTDWEAFASYAFNKSHSTCYAFVAFQTGYLKAHYPGEYMSALLTNNQGNIDKVTFFMEECRRMGIPVLGPDVNESQVNFAVNKKGEIRFGLGAIKGVGEAAVEVLIKEREENGPFKSLFDLTKRVNVRAVNKKTIEGLALAGALDCFGNVHRAQYFAKGQDEVNAIEKAIRYASAAQSNEAANQQSLFGEASMVTLAEPVIPPAEPWNLMEKLRQEKEVTGMYLSGHPLDDFKLEFDNFVTCDVARVDEHRNKEISIAGIVTDVFEKMGKNNKPYATFTVEDYSSPIRITMWSEDYLKFRHFITRDQMLFLKGAMKLRYNSEDQYEFKVNQIMLLAEVRERLLNKVTLTIKSDKLKNGFVMDFHKMLESYKGTATLRLNIQDEEQKIQVGTVATKLKVMLDNDMVKKLEEMEIGYKLN
jgi:DNA polymerase-3 subunit alpha